MTLLLSSQNLSKSHGSRLLFKELSFGIFSDDKIGCIGPNGSGKSTLLRILAGLDSPDEGLIVRNRSLRVGYVPQEATFDDRPLISFILEALHDDLHASEEYKQAQAGIILTKMGFTDLGASAASLSGGWKKRLSLAIELVRNPEILLLDEPTNHLDIEGVLWLEKFLQNASFAYIVISHDRYFLEHITTRMMELNKCYPKGLFFVDGSYTAFLEKREEFLSGQVQQEKSLNSKVRREVEWLKQNPKARTTKSQSRIQEANRLIKELQEVKTRHSSSKSQIDFSSLQRSQKLLAATNLTKSMGERPLFAGIDLTLSPGVRLGIVGLNGSGKTTLLRLLAGELQPDKGTVKVADGAKIVYFDQQRAKIPSDVTLRRALAPQGETVYYRGQPIHVNSWCKRFLFSPERLDLPFGHLSGGEKARVHIARLMQQPADILLLDEPTNDLDIPTLEILESSLEDFPGALVLISHDRYMLDQISNVILGLGTETDGELFADYRQWEEAIEKIQGSKISTKDKNEKKESSLSKPEERSRKMSYSEKREWEKMEESILKLEVEIERLHAEVQNPFVANQPEKLQEACQALDIKQKELERLFNRWEELEKKQTKQE